MSWIKIPSTKSVNETGFLGDIESRLPNGHPYKNPRDKINWVHEGTHGINSYIRNEHCKSDENGIYVMGGWAMIMEEPPITLKHLAKIIPENKRGPRYNLYLVQQQQYWNKYPLYICDEWAAYCNGCFMAQEIRNKRSFNYSLSCTIEFLQYMLVLKNWLLNSQIKNDDYMTFVRFAEIRTGKLVEN